MKKTNLIFIILFTFLIINCDRKTEKKEKIEDKMVYPDVSFNEDSAYSYVAKQVSFGPRVPGTKAHLDCAKWLFEKMSEYTKDVKIQNFDAVLYNNKTVKGKNIIASFNSNSKKRILFGAHWDSRPYADHDPDTKNHNTPIDGANDGASGVGVLIEIARQLSLKQPNVGIDIIFFDVEDYGEPQGVQSTKEDNWCLGSQFWAKNPHIAGYNAYYGILLDMVGGKNAQFTKEGTSMHFAADFVNKIWKIANDLGYSSYFINYESPAITDDHLYINKIAKIPMIDIIEHSRATEHGFNVNWHTLNDNIKNIDKNTLSVVGKVCLTAIYIEK